MPVIINPKNTEEYERERAGRETKKPEITAARWNESEVKEGEEAELSAEVKDIADRNMVTFQVWKEGQDPAAHIAQAQIPAGIEGGVAKGKWLYRLPGDAELPEQDPKWYFTVHSAWCPWKKSGNLTVELKRPELSEAEWLDKDGNGTGKGLVGAALKLQVSCNADTEEGAGVICKVYPDGADPRYDQPVAELSSRNGGGKAEAEWRPVDMREEGDATELKYFYTATALRASLIESDTIRALNPKVLEIRWEPEAVYQGDEVKLFIKTFEVSELNPQVTIQLWKDARAGTDPCLKEQSLAIDQDDMEIDIKTDYQMVVLEQDVGEYKVVPQIKCESIPISMNDKNTEKLTIGRYLLNE
jgi:hypothetical protein